MGKGDEMRFPAGSTDYVSEGRDAPPTGVQFSESVWDGGIQLYKFWEGVQVYSFLPSSEQDVRQSPLSSI